MIRNLRMKCII